uniref:Calcium-transporting ATPase n=1 Tax=Rhizophora mucronata TaxID=61149 RepID=A0A2P2MNH2_RHIMU
MLYRMFAIFSRLVDFILIISEFVAAFVMTFYSKIFLCCTA